MSNTDNSTHSTGGSMNREGEEFKEQAREAKHEAQGTAEEVKEAAQHQAEELFGRQKERVASESEKLSAVFHKMADEFANQEQSYFSGCANHLAQYTDRFSRQLREKDLNTLVEQARQYGRREPALFIGGAIAAGFFVSRFLRSSSKHDTASNESQYR